jgi:hypothetical protein
VKHPAPQVPKLCQGFRAVCGDPRIGSRSHVRLLLRGLRSFKERKSAACAKTEEGVDRLRLTPHTLGLTVFNFPLFLERTGALRDSENRGHPVFGPVDCCARCSSAWPPRNSNVPLCFHHTSTPFVARARLCVASRGEYYRTVPACNLLKSRGGNVNGSPQHPLITTPVLKFDRNRLPPQDLGVHCGLSSRNRRGCAVRKTEGEVRHAANRWRVIGHS